MRLYRMTLRGRIAFANMAVVALVLLGLILLNPYEWARPGPVEQAAETLLAMALVMATFPLGLLVLLPPAMVTSGGLDWTAFYCSSVFFPLNAYLWGMMGEAAVQFATRLRARREGRRLAGRSAA